MESYKKRVKDLSNELLIRSNSGYYCNLYRILQYYWNILKRCIQNRSIANYEINLLETYINSMINDIYINNDSFCIQVNSFILDTYYHIQNDIKSSSLTALFAFFYINIKQ